MGFSDNETIILQKWLILIVDIAIYQSRGNDKDQEQTQLHILW